MTDKKYDWWESINSSAIWGLVIFLGVLVVVTSWDYSNSPKTFSKFGPNQLIVLGYIVLLLLFKYVRKIKVGAFLDIEFRDLQSHIKNVKDNVESLGNKLNKEKTLVATDLNLNYIRDEILKAEGNLEALKAKALQT